MGLIERLEVSRAGSCECPGLRIGFECRRCRREGWLLWSGVAALGHDTVQECLDGLSDGFYMRMPRKHRGDVEIICADCGMAQTGIFDRISRAKLNGGHDRADRSAR